MWNYFRFARRAAFVVVLVASISSCGSSSSRYRGALVHYDRALPSHDLVVDSGRDLFAEDTELGYRSLVDAVLLRNPSIKQARSGWRAALARYPQATRFDDPTLSYTLAPLSIGSDVDLGQVIQISQPLPYPGKRRLRGQVALAEAEVARHGYEGVRLRLALMAAHLYYDLYAVERALAINAEYEKELNEHRAALIAHLAAGHAWLDDALKVDVELGEVMSADIELEAGRDVIVAQLNELLHRRPELSLPPTPTSLPPPPAVTESSAELQVLAVRRRPEVRAAGARWDGESARIEVARRDFYPDFRVTGSYNSMWSQLEHELMIGFAVTIPLSRSWRHAAVDEAEARRDRAQSAVLLVEDRIRMEVERAHRSYMAALDVVAVYRDHIKPAATSRVEAIRVGLESGRTTFLEVLRADHDLLTVTLAYERALATANRRYADLDAATGHIADGRDQGDTP